MRYPKNRAELDALMEEVRRAAYNRGYADGRAAEQTEKARRFADIEAVKAITALISVTGQTAQALSSTLDNAKG